jgi:two-component system sensor histidine kinase HydH
MAGSRRLYRFLTTIPPWILIGAAAVMLPVVFLMAREHLNRQRTHSMQLMMEKGAALIRSFEAGTRHGMMGMGRAGFRLQRLLTETAKQPDIVYLAILEADGTIVAHSDPEQLGGIVLGRFDDGEGEEETLRWRTATDAGGRSVFEVYRRFRPFTGPSMMRHRHPGRMGTAGMTDPERYILVGLDMGPVEAARKADFQHTVTMALILLLVGFSGIVLLLMVQSFRSTRESLSRVQAFSDSLVAHMPVGLLALTDRMTVASLNPVGSAILGIPGAGAVGRPARGMLPDTLIALARETAEGRRVLAREVRCTRADGSALPLEVSASALSYGEGRSLGTILLFTDLTEMVALRREVALSQRLAAIGQLAAGVAHEIRNPLSSIKGFATVFQERHRETPEDREIAALMVQEVDRLNRVVTQLLDFARPVVAVKQPTRPERLLEETRHLVADQAERAGVSLRIRSAPDLPAVHTDPDKIRQVLLNLCLNALEAMPGGGTLSLSAEPAEGDGWTLRVSDTGEGISEADLGRIFEPYFTTRSTGTGLGLAIVHSVLDALGWSIRVDSRPGEGTTVTLRTPAGQGSQNHEKTR